MAPEIISMLDDENVLIGYLNANSYVVSHGEDQKQISPIVFEIFEKKMLKNVKFCYFAIQDP